MCLAFHVCIAPTLFLSFEGINLSPRSYRACSSGIYLRDHDQVLQMIVTIDRKCQLYILIKLPMSESKYEEKLFALGHPKFSGFWFRNENRMKVHNFKFRVQKLVRSTKVNSALSYPCTFMSSISAVLLQRMSVCKAKNVSPASYKILP